MIPRVFSYVLRWGFKASIPRTPRLMRTSLSLIHFNNGLVTIGPWLHREHLTEEVMVYRFSLSYPKVGSRSFLWLQAPPRECDSLALAQNGALNYQKFNFAEEPCPILSLFHFSTDLLTNGLFLDRVPLDEEAMISQVFSQISRATIPLKTSGVPQTEETGIIVLPRISPWLENFRRDFSNRSDVSFLLACLLAQLSTTKI